jgi:hypothetical protein
MLLSDTGDNETEIDATTDLVVGAYTLWFAGITGGSPSDGFNGEQWKILVK